MARPTRKSRTLEFDQEGLIVGMMLFLFVGPTKKISSEIPFLKRSFFLFPGISPVTFPVSGHFSALFSTTHRKIVPKIPVRYLALHRTFQANCAY